MKNSTQSMPCPPSMSRRWLLASAGIVRARLMLIPHPYPVLREIVLTTLQIPVPTSGYRLLPCQWGFHTI